MFIRERCCPKCGGSSLYLDREEGQWFEHCFLCGYEVQLKETKTGTSEMSSRTVNIASGEGSD